MKNMNRGLRDLYKGAIICNFGTTAKFAAAVGLSKSHVNRILAGKSPLIQRRQDAWQWRLNIMMRADTAVIMVRVWEEYEGTTNE